VIFLLNIKRLLAQCAIDVSPGEIILIARPQRWIVRNFLPDVRSALCGNYSGGRATTDAAYADPWDFRVVALKSGIRLSLTPAGPFHGRSNPGSLWSHARNQLGRDHRTAGAAAGIDGRPWRRWALAPLWERSFCPTAKNRN